MEPAHALDVGSVVRLGCPFGSRPASPGSSPHAGTTCMSPKHPDSAAVQPVGVPHGSLGHAVDVSSNRDSTDTIALKIIGSGSPYLVAHSRTGQSNASTLTPVCMAVRPVFRGSAHEPASTATGPPSPGMPPSLAPPASVAPVPLVPLFGPLHPTTTMRRATIHALRTAPLTASHALHGEHPERPPPIRHWPTLTRSPAASRDDATRRDRRAAATAAPQPRGPAEGPAAAGRRCSGCAGEHARGRSGPGG